MTTRYVLGIDPGSKKSGHALLASNGRMGRPAFVSGGMCASDEDSIVAMLEMHRATCDLTVAIELPVRQFGEHRGGEHLLATRGVADAVSMAARLLGLPVVKLTAQQARNAMCRGARGTAGDAAVRRAVGMFVTNLPSRSSTHVRDAILVACVAMMNQGRIARTG